MATGKSWTLGSLGVAALAAAAWAFVSLPERPRQSPQPTIRVGYFPNLTHAQALVALNFARHGEDWFSSRLQGRGRVEWHAFNAGPSAMMSLIARSLDFSYAGPNSILNAYALSKGRVRVVAGAVTGGSALAVQPRSNLLTPANFKGRSIATPEFGNTQDISARAWLSRGGLTVGKDAQVVPIANPDQINLFRLRSIDAAWTVEPWVSRLELLGDATIVVEEKDIPTTVLAANTQFAARHKELAEAFISSHRDLTEWMIGHPLEAQGMLTEELRIRFKTDMPEVVLRHAWPRIHLTSKVSIEEFRNFLTKAKDAGFAANLDVKKLFEPNCGADACAIIAAAPDATFGPMQGAVPK